ncbi:MAG: dienelactone hydrolase family protein [Planctomycetaceae bacterium]|nr:dienelactone hydrolase family protein [Planctomycetaceae bacterium]
MSESADPSPPTGENVVESSGHEAVKRRRSGRKWWLLLLLVVVAAGYWWMRHPQPDAVRQFEISTATMPSASVSVDVFLPPTEVREAPLPAVIVLHGVEGTSPFYRGFHLTNARQIADAGYAVYLVHYFDPHAYSDLLYLKGQELDTERIDEHIYGAKRADREAWEQCAFQAVQWVGEQPEVDGDNVFLLGYSLGGCVAISCAERCAQLERQPLRGLVVNFACQFRDMELTATLPDTQMHHGANDSVVLPEWMAETARRMQACGTRVDSHVYAGQEHTLTGTAAELCRQRTHDFLQGLIR